jgi:hypothetical protein
MLRWFVACAAAGCTIAEEERIAFPPSAGGRAAVFAVETGGRIVRAHALSLDGDRRLQVDRIVEGGSTLHALVYPKTLGALGLDSGPVVESTATDAAPLPETSDHYVVEVDDVERGWVRTSDLGALRTFAAAYDRAYPHAGCRDFAVSRVAISSTATWSSSAAIDDRSVLVLTNAPQQFVVTATSSVEVAVDAPGMTPIAVAVAGGEVFYGTFSGLWRGRLDDGRVVGASEVANVGAPLRWLSARLDPFEVVAVDPGGQIFVADDEGVTVVDRVDLSSAPISFAAVAMGDGDALVVADSLLSEAIHIRGRTATRELHAFAGVDSLLTLTHVPGFGYVAGTSNGQVARRTDGGAWSALPPTGYSLEIGAVGGTAGRVYYGGTNGAFGEYVFDRPEAFCPVIYPVTSTLRAIHGLGSGIMLIPKFQLAEVAILSPR